MVELMGCHETSARIYYYMLRNSPEERSSYVAVLPLSGNIEAQWLSNPQAEEIGRYSYR
jgi:hypothetical protein